LEERAGRGGRCRCCCAGYDAAGHRDGTGLGHELEHGGRLRRAEPHARNHVCEITYVVRRGDSLSSIARRFNVSVDKLVEWNAGAAKKYLQPGQRLKMVVDITAQSG
jgi:hypothetical protein